MGSISGNMHEVAVTLRNISGWQVKLVKHESVSLTLKISARYCVRISTTTSLWLGLTWKNGGRILYDVIIIQCTLPLCCVWYSCLLTFLSLTLEKSCLKIVPKMLVVSLKEIFKAAVFASGYVLAMIVLCLIPDLLRVNLSVSFYARIMNIWKQYLVVKNCRYL